MASIASTAPLDVKRLPPLLLRCEVACLARCTTKTVAKAEHAGLLVPARPNRSGGATRTLYRREDVLRWLGLDEAAR